MTDGSLTVSGQFYTVLGWAEPGVGVVEMVTVTVWLVSVIFLQHRWTVREKKQKQGKISREEKKLKEPKPGRLFISVFLIFGFLEVRCRFAVWKSLLL